MWKTGTKIIIYILARVEEQGLKKGLINDIYMQPIIPSLLKPGDRISVIAPSGVVKESRIEKGILLLEAWGLEVERGRHLYCSNGLFAGNDEERLNDLQLALDDESVKAVFCARGGYGLSRIIDRLDPAGFLLAPKWIIGYSDITVLHLWFNSLYGTATVHGEMVSNFNIDSRSPESLDSLYRLLFRGEGDYTWKSENFRDGKVSSLIAGGNLSLIANLTGTHVREWLAGKILFIEDTGEYLYRIDRMLMDLRLSGILENISGLVVGGLSGMTDPDIPFGIGIEEMIMDAVSDYRYPVAFNFPAGHINDNRAFYLGVEITLKVDSGEISIVQGLSD